MPAPRFLGYQALLGEPKPINWQGIGQALWETNLNAPIRGAYNLMNTPYEVLAGGPSPELDQAVADSFDAAGGVTVGSMPIPKPSNSLTMGIKAYHGSPHSFDKFSMDKIGTGEGAQAYGHGLYFAENEGVAKGYRDTLSRQTSYDGAPTSNFHPSDSNTSTAISAVAQRVADGEDPASAIAAEAAKWRAAAAPFAKAAIEKPELASAALQRAKSLEDVAAATEALDPSKFAKNPGSMYEVNIDADPNAFLDWDKPLSEQPDVLKRLGYSTRTREQINAEGEALVAQYGSVPNMPPEAKSRWAELETEFDKVAPNVSGADYYRGSNPDDYLHSVLSGGNSDPFNSSWLLDKGIPGIKYLDAGSRVPSRLAQKELDGWKEQLSYAENELAKARANGERHRTTYYEGEVKRVQDGIARVQKEADGTRNYVVFDDSKIEIVRKFGIAGASAMLGYDVLTGANEAQAKAVNKADLDHRYDNFLKSGGI
jgi:hypothetical protein